MRFPPINIIAGLGLIALVFVAIGWPDQQSVWGQFDHGLPMALPAAIGFAIAGMALLAARPADTVVLLNQAGARSGGLFMDDNRPGQISWGALGSDILAGILMLLGILGLMQWAGNLDPGLEQSLSKEWLGGLSSHPVRIKPITASGLAATGLAIILLHRAQSGSMLLVTQLLTLGILFIGVLGIIGQVLSLEAIYSGYSGITLHTGMGFVICSTGLLSIQFRDIRYQQYWEQDNSRKIILIGGMAFVMTGLIGVFSGFSVLRPQTVNGLENNLQLSLKSRGEKFENGIEQGLRDSFTYASQPLRLELMKDLNRDPENPVLRGLLQQVADGAAVFGFSAVSFRNGNGREVARAGSFVNSSELDVKINAPYSSHLLWTANGFVLHTRINMKAHGMILGTMEAEHPLGRLNQALHDAAYLGKTTDFAICAPSGENMHCFPFRSTGGKPLHNLPSRFDGKPIPMSYALAGKSGIIHSKDYRGQEVIAAYGPLGATGLGMVLKIDSAELYEPIASTLGKLLVLLFPMVAMGIALLRIQVLPLVRKMAEEIDERKKAESQLSFLAYHDTLTDLPNRLLVQDRFNQAKAFAGRGGTKVALLFLDLDNFKTINDSLGHSCGDGALKVAAARLQDCVRNTDTISRLGGDEFLAVLANVRDSNSITGITEKILARQAEPFEIDGIELSISFSTGIAVYPDDGEDFESLLKKADAALFRAKEEGRNTFRFYTRKMGDDAVEHLTMLHGLRKALERGEFVLHYQPQLELASNRIIGAEALIRWNHPELGLISPLRFIPVAEESGLILPIGEWVLQEACRQAVAWRDGGMPGIIVAVNLSAVQFKRGNVKKCVISALSKSGLSPAGLELELTESILIQDTENALSVLQQLKALGVKLSIDDFGTGYSSLSYLKRFSVDKLKIDQSFVRDMGNDPNDAAIVQAIIQMAKTLNLRTIAEGVENDQALSGLRKYHCDEVQGYYFARPMTAEDFSGWVQRKLSGLA